MKLIMQLYVVKYLLRVQKIFH